jgi:hypothetical protein
MALCRASYQNGIHPGKLVGSACNIGWGGKEIVIASGFQVLVRQTDPLYEQYFPMDNWVAPTFMDSNNTFFGGVVGTTPLRVCRAQQNNAWHPGKEVDGKCNIGWGGNEMVFPQYQVLSLYNTAAGGNRSGT